MKGKKSPKAIRTALLNLSTGSEAYDEAYDKAMERINSQALDEEKLAKQALSWITCAKRPLSSLELQHALAVEIGEAALDEDNISMVDDIVSVCAGLVTVDEESRMIRLVHHTTQDYFVRKRSIWFPNAEAEIAAVCLSYISFEDFESGPCPTDEEFAKRMHSHPLYKYAACNWGHHARAAGSTVQNIDSFVRSEVQLDAAFQALTMTDLEHEYPEYSQMFPKAMTSLHLVAYFGLQAPSSQLAKKEVLDLPNSRGLTPMSIAASRGHIDTVRLLLEHGADLSATDDNGSTPLTWAAEKGHENIARLLLENGADVDAKDNYGQTPLCLAASYGEEEVAKLLLKNGADVDTRDERGQTPLCLAASYGEEGMVRLLLENGADIESKDESGQGPLCLAAMHENEAIAKLLIKNKARIDTTDEHGQTPLHVTVSYGEKDMVKLLLRKGANINATDEHNQTSLHLAVLNAQGDIIKLLIQNGADANAVDEYGRTPLVLAALLGQKDIVKLFFEQRT
jgi:ankyrin repeat protein